MFLTSATLAFSSALSASPQLLTIARDPPDPQAAGEGEVLARGPVHEAFAETIQFDPEPGIEAAFAPRDAIEEIPPDVRPEGEDLQWIPGYFAWDDERTDYIWISGIWRSVPPGREWVPGYWTPSENGFRWVSGYWGDCDTAVAEYLPEPPASIEIGPNLPAPSTDSSWIPGCWMWRTTHYAWRPGYFVPPQPNWLWVPDHYVACPRGFVFVSGYWDVPIDVRGVVFAPMYFAPMGNGPSHHRFFPTFVINTHLFLDHLFVRPNFGHYYFGDYYGANDHHAGFVSAFHYGFEFGGFDPIFAYERAHHDKDRDWSRRIDLAIADRREHADQRPPRNFGDHKPRTDRDGRDGRDGRPGSNSDSLLVPLTDLADGKGGTRKLRELDVEERRELSDRGGAVRGARDERANAESAPRNPPDPKRSSDPTIPEPSRSDGSRSGPPPERIKRAQSPIVSKTVRDPALRAQVPARTPAPAVDPKVEPQRRSPSKSVGKPTNPGKRNPGKGNPSPRKPNEP